MDTEHQQIDVLLSQSGKHLVCPETGKLGALHDHRKARNWRHVALFQCKCFTHCRIPRFPSSAEIKTLEVPLAEASSCVNYAFERWTVYLQGAIKNQTKTARLLRCGFNQLHRILHRGEERRLQRRYPDAIHYVSLDESALKRSQVYVTIVRDATHGIAIDVGEGRDNAGTMALLRCIIEGINDEVETISMGIWKAYLKAQTVIFPNATFVHDRFHLIQYLNKAINRVRRRDVMSRPKLKGSRHALLKNEAHRTEKQDEIIKVVQVANLELSLRWRLREEFKGIFACTSCAEAETYFERWLTSMQASTMKEVIRVAERFQKHFDGVCNALCHDQSNARAKRIDGEIQEVKPSAEAVENLGPSESQSCSSAEV